MKEMLTCSTTERQYPSEFLTLALLKALYSLFHIQGPGCQQKKRILGGKKLKKILNTNKNHNIQGEGQGISLKKRLQVPKGKHLYRRAFLKPAP